MRYVQADTYLENLRDLFARLLRLIQQRLEALRIESQIDDTNRLTRVSIEFSAHSHLTIVDLEVAHRSPGLHDRPASVPDVGADSEWRAIDCELHEEAIMAIAPRVSHWQSRAVLCTMLHAVRHYTSTHA